MSPPGYTPLEPTLPGPGKINVFHKADPQLFQSEALGLAIAILCRVRTRHIARLGHVAALISRVLHGFGRPVAVILHVEPAPNLGITVKSDNVPADGLIMIPDRLLRLPADPRGGACLLAKVEAFPVSQNQVPLDHAFRAAGKRNAGLCAPAPGSRGISVAGDHVVVSLQTVGNLVENPAVLVVGDEALAHDAVFVANIEPDAMTAIAEESASLQDGVAAQHQLVAASLPTPVEAFGVVVLDQAFREQQVVGAIGAKPHLAIVPEDTPPDLQVFRGKGRPAAVHVFHGAVLQQVMPARQHYRAMLRHVGGKSEAQPRACT